MKINWFGYFVAEDGYGRFNRRMVAALRGLGCDVACWHIGVLDKQDWLDFDAPVDWTRLSITCTPPYMLKPLPQPARQWAFTMVEGSLLPRGWVNDMRAAGVERVLVPCKHNAEAFRRSGVTVPISVIPGGTDPEEFPVLRRPYERDRPYTFLCLADRGARKGWLEVFDAFYAAFGGKTTGDPDVRLIIKSRKTGHNVTELIAEKGDDSLDRRIVYQASDESDMAAVYAQADCVVIPSYVEGWGMPHREATCLGLPVITQAYSGLDDGHTHEWAILLTQGRIVAPPSENGLSIGEWMVPDVGEIAERMRACYERPDEARKKGLAGARWIRANQTWSHSASALLELIEREARPALAAETTGEFSYAF